MSVTRRHHQQLSISLAQFPYTYADQTARPMFMFQIVPGSLSRMGSLPGTIHCQANFGASAMRHRQAGFDDLRIMLRCQTHC